MNQKQFNNVCKIVEQNDFTNIIELKEFLDSVGYKYNIINGNAINKINENQAELLGLYFDAIRQKKEK